MTYIPGRIPTLSVVSIPWYRPRCVFYRSWTRPMAADGSILEGSVPRAEQSSSTSTPSPALRSSNTPSTTPTTLTSTAAEALAATGPGGCSAVVIQQRSRRACTANYSFGCADRSTMWTTQGCRGLFRLHGHGHGPGVEVVCGDPLNGLKRRTLCSTACLRNSTSTNSTMPRSMSTSGFVRTARVNVACSTGSTCGPRFCPRVVGAISEADDTGAGRPAARPEQCTSQLLLSLIHI